MTDLNLQSVRRVTSCYALPDAKAASLGAISELVQELAGYDLFTVLRCCDETQETVREFSTDQATYPLGGRKPFNPNVRTPAFLSGQAPHISSTRQEILDTYGNDNKLRALDYISAVNVPILWDGKLVGMFNFLSNSKTYSEFETQQVLQLAPFGVPALI